MTRSKRTPRSFPVGLLPRNVAHIPNAHSTPRRQRRRYSRQKHRYSDISHSREDDSEDTYRSMLQSIHDADAEDDDARSYLDASSDDQEWDEETTLVEMLGSPAENQERILQTLGRVFADASRSLREEVILGLRPALVSARGVRPAPGRAFITGLLGFDDACKQFEENSYRNAAAFNKAYAKIEAEIDEVDERLRAAYSRLEEKRAIFEGQVKEQTNKMRKIINSLPADVDALLAELDRKYKDMDLEEGSTRRTKGRERTAQGALAELQL
ncbi:hypothetical protein BC826DRAFT_129738 [Russula brevipes]|nr:hypothetical protein BC826DRAFT_133346 [Russula brevipes]KAI0284918.1 hypothetical protein BC826DRAFT_129738 [Russula brevipes]